MTPKKVRVAAFGLLIICAIAGIVVFMTMRAPQHRYTPPISQQSNREVTYKGVPGKNALQLLQQKFSITTKHYEGMGDMVTGINGITPDAKHFWAFYVNGKLSQVGAEQYQTQPSDTLSWKIEAVQ